MAARHAVRGSVLHKQQHMLGEPSRALFEFMEVERPHLRQPLHDKVLELAEEWPQLLSLDTRDLHPTSWMAVTWVPIYRCVRRSALLLHMCLPCWLTSHGQSHVSALLADEQRPGKEESCSIRTLLLRLAQRCEF
jgi:hypothetical protein